MNSNSDQTRPIYILNGPNLNRLGQREASIYGTATLADIEATCRARAEKIGLAIDFRQSNEEGTLIDWVQEAADNGSGLIINAAAYSHTSIALYDAIQLCKFPVIEVHISNIYARESFRHHSVISAAATGIICGLGADGYILALEGLAAQRKQTST